MARFEKGDIVQFDATHGSIGKVIGRRPGSRLLTVTWVYGLDRSGAEMTGTSHNLDPDSLREASLETYDAVRLSDPPAWGPSGLKVERKRTLPATSEHGPCADGDAAVRDQLPPMPDDIADWCRARLDAGEAKYGRPLRVGWTRAREALREELADAINYSVSMGDQSFADKLVEMLVEVWDGP